MEPKIPFWWGDCTSYSSFDKVIASLMSGFMRLGKPRHSGYSAWSLRICFKNWAEHFVEAGEESQTQVTKIINERSMFCRKTIGAWCHKVVNNAMLTIMTDSSTPLRNPKTLKVLINIPPKTPPQKITVGKWIKIVTCHPGGESYLGGG